MRLAAAAIIVTTAVIAAAATTVAAAIAAATAAAAEQEQQDEDDNPGVVAAATKAGILITHSVTSYEIYDLIYRSHSMVCGNRKSVISFLGKFDNSKLTTYPRSECFQKIRHFPLWQVPRW